MSEIQTTDILGVSQGIRAYKMYEKAFTELNKQTVQRHMMTPDEFLEVMFDNRILKYIVDDGTKVTALAAYTNDLYAVPLISPEYFEHNYPELYEQQRIWYCLFVAVDDDAKPGTFMEVVNMMYALAEATNSVIGIDFCGARDKLRGVVKSMLKRTSDNKVNVVEADHQTYMLYFT